MGLDYVSVAATVSLLLDVAGISQVIDDRVGMTVGDVELGRDIAQADAGIVRDGQQCSGVVRQEAPVRHLQTIANCF